MNWVSDKVLTEMATEFVSVIPQAWALLTIHIRSIHIWKELDTNMLALGNALRAHGTRVSGAGDPPDKRLSIECPTSELSKRSETIAGTLGNMMKESKPMFALRIQ